METLVHSRQMKSSDVVGTFLICCALLAFEVSTVRTINFTIGSSYIFIAIALAMVGLTAAGSLLSTIDLNALKARRERVLAGLCLAIALLLVMSHTLTAEEKTRLNDAVRAAGMENGEAGLMGILIYEMPKSAMYIGAILTLPYFLFGALLSYLFATSRVDRYAVLYGADLIGAAFGCVLIVLLMEWTGYAMSVTAPAICAALAAAAYASANGKKLAISAVCFAFCLAVFAQQDWYQNRIEPAADPNYLVRDYDYSTTQTEVWTGWNSFTRVGSVENTETLGQRAVLSIGNGDGQVFMFPHVADRQTPLRHTPVRPALLTGDADNALVIFAGVGSDLMTLRDHGVESVTGVELNGRIVEAGLALENYNLEEFLAQDGVELHVDEARAFLERDRETYDLILLSWSGASVVYHVGALGGTTQYVYTYEGLSAVFDHLSPGGRAVIMEMNKVDALVALRRYMEERGLPNPAQAAIVLFRDSGRNVWDRSWDDNPLLIKLDGWSDEDVASIQARAAESGEYDFAYAPGLDPHPDYMVYDRILNAADPEMELATISAETGKAFGYSTDDRPFYLDHFDPKRYLTLEFWLGTSDGPVDLGDLFHHMRIMIVLGVAGVAFALAVLPLLFAGRANVSRGRASVYMAYFMLLGAGFMFIEIALIQQYSILLPNPGQAIAVVLCGVILSTGIGSLISNKTFALGFGFRTCVALVFAYAVIVSLVSPFLIEAALGFNLYAKITLIMAVIAPGGVLMGHLFPQGIAQAGAEDKSLTPWAWAINGAMSASVAGIAPLAAQVVGFGALYIIGAVLYLMVMLLPLRQKSGFSEDLAEPAFATGT